MPLQLVTPPAGEPISLAEAKLHLRVDGGDDDPLIGSLITAARQAAETITGRQLMTARWRLVLDAFPGPLLMHAGSGSSFSLPAHAILLAKCPVQSVVSVEYLDMNGTMQVLPATMSEADIRARHGRNLLPCTITRQQLVGHILQIGMTLPSGEAVSLEGHADKYRDSLTTGAGAFVVWNPSDATLILP